MAYRDFNLATVRDRFDLTFEENRDLFAEVMPVAPSEMLSLMLSDYLPLATAIATEKARSEFLIAQSVKTSLGAWDSALRQW